MIGVETKSRPAMKATQKETSGPSLTCKSPWEGEAATEASLQSPRSAPPRLRRNVLPPRRQRQREQGEHRERVAADRDGVDDGAEGPAEGIVGELRTHEGGGVEAETRQPGAAAASAPCRSARGTCGRATCRRR